MVRGGVFGSSRRASGPRGGMAASIWGQFRQSLFSGNGAKDIKVNEQHRYTFLVVKESPNSIQSLVGTIPDPRLAVQLWGCAYKKRIRSYHRVSNLVAHTATTAVPGSSGCPLVRLESGKLVFVATRMSLKLFRSANAYLETQQILQEVTTVWSVVLTIMWRYLSATHLSYVITAELCCLCWRTKSL